MRDLIMTTTTRHARQLDREFLQLLLAAGKPRTLPELFEGLSPRWAVAACDRCEIAGHVRETVGGAFELLPSGRALAGVVASKLPA